MAKTALDAERETLWKLDPDKIVIVGYDTDDGLEHPLVNERLLKMKREGFNRPELIASLMAEGQQQNVVVRKNGQDDAGEDRLECVIGRNRVLAGREVKRLLREAGGDGVFMLRAVLRKNNDVGSLTGAVAAENGVRYDDDMLTKARDAQRLLDMGQSKLDVARKMGMRSVEVLDNHLRVLELSPKMQDAVERGVITATAAATFADMSHEDQDAKIAEAEAAGIIISVPEARRQKKARSAARNGKSSKEVSTRGKGITIGVLRKVADDEKFTDSLGTEAARLLKWVIGEGSHRSVPGLGQALRRVGELDTPEAEE
jgi:ParB-like chromosome segregation protein Spo0J